MSPQLRRPLRRALLLGLILSAVGISTLGVLWQHGILKKWVQARVVETYMQKVQPHLPFHLEEVDTDVTLRELWRGHISRISLVLRWEDWRLRMAGPIDLKRPSTSNPFYQVRYLPSVTIEPARALGWTAKAGERSSPVTLDLSVETKQNLSGLSELKILTHPDTFQWPFLGIQLKEPHLAARWKGEEAAVSFSLKSLGWKRPTRSVNLTDLKVNANTHLKLKPFDLGPQINFEWNGKSAEILWNEIYLDLPLSQLPGKGHLTLSPERLDPRGLVLDLGVTPAAGQPAPLHLEGTRSANSLHVKWKTTALPIRELVEGLLAASGSGSGPFAPLTRLRPIDIRAGRIQSEGMASLPLASRGLPVFEGAVHVDNLALQWRAAALAARGIKLDLPFSSRNGLQGLISVPELYFKHLKAKLEPTRVSLKALGPHALSPEGLQIRMDAEAGSHGTLPLSVDGIPFEFGAMSGRLKLGDEDPFEVESSLKLPPIGLDPLARLFCFKGRLPPATVEAEFTRLNIGPGDFDPDGRVVMRVFDGEIRIDEIGLFDAFSEVPEVDFNMVFGRIRLDLLGEWLGFGEMIGILQGSAQDVTFQRWLPTHFDFSIDAIPVNRWIEFSPESMKNLVGLFAGDALDSLPGFANDTFFGMISRRLGGFDVKYAGLSLFSNDGTILLETHDPPDIYAVMKKRYIFWGHRFKMPVESDQYPVVMDSTGLARVISRMAERFRALAQAKAEEEARKNPALKKENENKENEDETDPACLPPVF